MEVNSVIQINTEQVDIMTTENPFTIGDYIIPQKTMALHYVTGGINSDTISSKKEWGVIEGCPARIMYMTQEHMVVNSFHSSETRAFKIVLEDFNYFDKAEIVDDKIIAPKYPGQQINLIEFDYRNMTKVFTKKIEDMIKKPTCDPMVKKIIQDKLFQMIVSQGASYIKITDYLKYLNGEIPLSPNERFGSEIFNRNCRWCPPIDITYDEFKASKSYPAPLGIRPKDFCFPSELCDTIRELLTQIYNFKNIDKASFADIRDELEERDHHKCKYSGEVIDALSYSSTYMSETNYIEICHRDPNDRFLVRNMYWGTGESNRRQGGYSEEDRIEDAIRLLMNNQEHFEKYKEQLQKLTQNKNLHIKTNTNNIINNPDVISIPDLPFY